MMFPRSHGIIVACDVPNQDELTNLVRQTADLERILGYKIGKTLGLRFGLPEIVSTIRNHTELPIIFDGQKEGNDVKYTVEEFVDCYVESGVDGVIIFPFAGPENVVGFIELLRANDLPPIGGFELTQPIFYGSDKDGIESVLSDHDLSESRKNNLRERFNEFQFSGFIRRASREDVLKIYAGMDLEYHIAPGNKPEAVRQKRSLLNDFGLDDFSFLMPGIGRQKGTIQESFAAAGAREERPAYAIIGSAIYNGSGPSGSADGIRDAAEQFCYQIEEVVESNEPT